MASTLLHPLTLDECSINVLNDLGPAQVVLTPYCRGTTDSQAANPTPIIIPCSDQRDDLQFTAGLSYIEIPNQCSTRTRKQGASSFMRLQVSLGLGSTRFDLLACMFESQVENDSVDSQLQRLHIRDRQGARPNYYQVDIQPLVDGAPSDEWSIVMLYAYPMVEEANFVFSPSNPRAVTFMLEGEMHPTENSLGFFQSRFDVD